MCVQRKMNVIRILVNKVKMLVSLFCSNIKVNFALKIKESAKLGVPVIKEDGRMWY